MKRIKQNKKGINVLTNDPSMTAWGWAILDVRSNIVVSTGCIKTEPNKTTIKIRKGDDWMRRIREINSVLLSLIKKYNIKYLLSELPHGSQSSSAAKSQGTVAGVLDTLAVCTDLGLEWFLEGDCKKEVCGARSISKDDMVVLMKGKFKDVIWKNTKWIDQGVADSLAVYCLAKKQSGILKYLSR